MWIVIASTSFTIRHAPIKSSVAPPATRWNITDTGLRYVDDVIGETTPVNWASVRFNLSKFNSGQIIQATGERSRQVSLNDTTWTRILSGMKIGGKRRLLLSPDDIQSDVRRGTTLQLDVEMTNPDTRRFLPTRRTNLLILLLLSFFPYLIPVDYRPSMYQSPPTKKTS